MIASSSAEPRKTSSHWFTSVDLPLAKEFPDDWARETALDASGVPIGLEARREQLLRHTFRFGIARARHKPGRLTDGEFELIKQHPVIGDRLCGNLRSLRMVRLIVRHHHERLDGSGYPDGLRGDAVPLLAQIVSIADAYDAITTTRPYRAALPPDHAYAELRADAAAGARRSDLVEKLIELGREGKLRGSSDAD